MATKTITLQMFGKALVYLIILFVCLAVVFPIYWMINASVQKTMAFFTYPPDFFPKLFTLESYWNSFIQGRIFIWIKNSVIVVTSVVLLTLSFGCLAGYAFGRFEFRWKRLFLLFVLSTQMIPRVLVVIPLYITFSQVKLINTLFCLIIGNLALSLPLSIWLLMAFFATLPREVEEAALIDGCSRMGVYFRIALPLSMPSIITIAVITFFDVWNEYIFSLTFINDASKWVGSVGIASFRGEITTDIGLIMSSATLFAIVPIAVYIFLQRYVVSGITAGALKG